MKLDPLFYVFGTVSSDCNEEVIDFLGKYPSEEEANEIKEIFEENYTFVEVLEG